MVIRRPGMLTGHLSAAASAGSYSPPQDVHSYWESCHFCLHAADNDRRFSCLAYECFVLLDTVCDS